MTALVLAKNNVTQFLRKHQKFLMFLTAYIMVFFIIPHAIAGTTGGDLQAVDKHVQSEVKGDVMDILGWVCFALGCISAVAKMNMGVVISMFGLFLVLTLGPGVIAAHFSALI